MEFLAATRAFERWLASQTPIVQGDLRHKHAAMKIDPFSFLRATYYRWAQQFASLPIAKAPKVLSVGDLHLENFGTWRDRLGRLAWGINDFDEAYPLPYTHDLVRLAASALLAIEENHLGIKSKAAFKAIIDGYRAGLETGGKPFVIGEEHRWFKPILQGPPRDPGKFWDKLNALPRQRGPIPQQAKAAIADMLPAAKLPYEVCHRVAGLGNLGKARYTALAVWEGGPVAREAKALTLSAASMGQATTAGPFYARILTGAIRSPDPFLKVYDSWIIRRLAPDCRRIELASLNRAKDEEWLLYAMGFETANVHLGAAGARNRIRQHLNRQSKNWLKKAALAMRDLVIADFKVWRGIK